MKDLDETRERFLAEVAGKLPPEKVVEVHLFHPIRQGGAQSGVAVVAVDEGDESRSTVYTARYRLTQKGPDRGKWEFGLKVEADAPLVTVDKVVQGVQRRSGDAEDPQRLTGDEFRALLPPTPTTPPPF
jgi:hypothetical protein